MPRYLTFVKANESFRATMPPPALFEAMDKFVAEITARGEMVMAGGLLPTSASSQVRVKDGKMTVTDGPFTEAKEVVGGFAMLQTADRARVMEISRQFMQLHVTHWPGWDGVSEIHEMFEEPAPPAK